ncbi:MAG TPA: hypothetical protein VFE32_15140 [Puia sp.]|nr:hypothetical protein [Puia sp.]
MRIVSLLLVLVFLQKLGVELWVHVYLHETAVAQSVTTTGKRKAVLQHSRIMCNCMEDVMMPLIETDAIRYDPASVRLTDIFLADYSSRLSNEKEFSALRGPPAFS